MTNPNWQEHIETQRNYTRTPNKTTNTPSYQLTSRPNAPDHITFILKDGARHFSSYATLQGGVLENDQLTLTFPNQIITIIGKNLELIQQAITTRRVVFLREGGIGSCGKDCEIVHIQI